MKKIITCLCTLVLLITLFSGCGSSFQYEFDLENASVAIYGDTESGYDFLTLTAESNPFEVQEYYQEDIPQTRTFTLLGEELVGEYLMTVQYAEADRESYVYKVQGSEYGKILVDVNTDKVVKYHMIPFNFPAMTSEEEYLAYAEEAWKEMGSFDVDAYDLIRSTRYEHEFTSYEGFSTERVDEFYIPTENDTILRYGFNYNILCDGVKLPGYITAHFFLDEEDPLITFEMCPAEHKNSAYKAVLDQMDEIEEKAEQNIMQRLNDGVILQKIEHKKKEIFVRDGKPYVKFTSEITFLTNASATNEFISIIETIIG